MKVKNVKRGVRVELKDNQGDNQYLKKGHLGTILEDYDNRPYVEWDDFDNGHNLGYPTKESSSWAVLATDLKKAPKAEK